MKRIDRRTVEFTDFEMQVRDRFELLLDEGHGIQKAAWAVMGNVTLAERLAHIEPGFVAYLSDGTVKYDPLTGAVTMWVQ